MAITGRKSDQDASNQRHTRAPREVHARLLEVLAAQRVKGSHGTDDERSRDHRGHHGVRVLDYRPGAEQKLKWLTEDEHAFEQGMADRMLHESVGRYDEVA